MMKLKMSSKMNAGNKMVAIVDGTKKEFRDFDSVVRGRQSYGGLQQSNILTKNNEQYRKSY